MWRLKRTPCSGHSTPHPPTPWRGSRRHNMFGPAQTGWHSGAVFATKPAVFVPRRRHNEKRKNTPPRSPLPPKRAPFRIRRQRPAPCRGCRRCTPRSEGTLLIASDLLAESNGHAAVAGVPPISPSESVAACFLEAAMREGPTPTSWASRRCAVPATARHSEGCSRSSCMASVAGVGRGSLPTGHARRSRRHACSRVEHPTTTRGRATKRHERAAPTKKSTGR